jgi:hypothetical protein
MKTSISILYRDLADGLRQQMYFWGLDAIHPDGNLFVRGGFHKRPSNGLQGTSCYSAEWQGGVIELHGSHAGWIGPDGGFLFIRPLGRCVRWLEKTPPVPGQWPADSYDIRVDSAMQAAAIPFLDWWLDHETMITRHHGPAYRESCYRKFRKLPKTRAWLPPDAAKRWIETLRDHPQSLDRARHFLSHSS